MHRHVSQLGFMSIIDTYSLTIIACLLQGASAFTRSGSDPDYGPLTLCFCSFITATLFFFLQYTHQRSLGSPNTTTLFFDPPAHASNFILLLPLLVAGSRLPLAHDSPDFETVYTRVFYSPFLRSLHCFPSFVMSSVFSSYITAVTREKDL